MTTPDPATKAVAEALWRRMSDPLERRAYPFTEAPSRMHYLAHAKAVVAAARPIIAAEALREAAGMYEPAQLTGAFAGTRSYTVVWLLNRADRIESEEV